LRHAANVARYHQSMRGKWIPAALAVVLAVAGAGAFWLLRRAPAPPPSQSPKPEQPVVNLAEANFPGTLRAQHVVDVEAGVSGTIESLEAGVGDEVYEGQLLARISSQLLEAERERALAAVEGARAKINSLEAAISAARLEASRTRADAARARREADQAERVFVRQRMLNQEGATPRLTFEKAQRDFENAQAEFQSLDAMARQAEERVGELMRDLDLSQRIMNDKSKQLEDAQAHLAAAEIHAPVAGLVVARKGEVGGVVDPENRNLFQIAVNLSLLEAVIDPEPPLLARFRVGQPALIVAADVPGEGIAGQVKAVENNQVVVDFVSPTPLLKPGMRVQVRVRLN